jgi:hypothetical protein
MTSTVLDFARALVNRDYASAYAMTSRGYQQRVPLETMREAFEAVVPSDFGDVTAVEIVQTMDDWPDKQPSDAGWAYVSIGGDVYSEALTVVVTLEDGSLKVRDVEFGRP